MIQIQKQMNISFSSKDRLFESIQDLFDKSEDLQTQLKDIGSEERKSNRIVLSVLSISMRLETGKTSGEVE